MVYGKVDCAFGEEGVDSDGRTGGELGGKRRIDKTRTRQNPYRSLSGAPLTRHARLGAKHTTQTLGFSWTK